MICAETMADTNLKLPVFCVSNGSGPSFAMPKTRES
jgi:hypothetical protein